MNEQQALLTAIQQNPDCDTARLVYADWLDEHNDPARAELIRVQIQLCRFGCPCPRPKLCCRALGSAPPTRLWTCGTKACQDWSALRQREHRLLRANAYRWRKGPKCEKCDGSGCPACWGTGDAGGLMRRFDSELARIVYYCGMKHVKLPRTIRDVHSIYGWAVQVRAAHQDVLTITQG